MLATFRINRTAMCPRPMGEGASRVGLRGQGKARALTPPRGRPPH